MDSGVKCRVCDKILKNKHQEQKHCRNFHGIQLRADTIICIEDNCSASFCTMNKYRDHLSSFHGIKEVDDTTQMIFPSMEDFGKWLSEEEMKTGTQFVRPTGMKSFKNHKFVAYSCNRSGTYVEKGEGKRQLKSIGSNKIGHHCTSAMKVKIFTDRVDVCYYSFHHKHDNRLGHMNISAPARNKIAGKLLQGVSTDRVIQDVRGETLGARDGLVTRKDVQNIKRCYGIDSVVPNDVLSVKTWVEENKESVIFYKAQGEQHENLPDDDFMLVVMTQTQQEMLRLHGTDRICVDSTHGTTGFDFQLTTVLVIDEFEEGFPAAFCLSSRVNYSTMLLFFSLIAQNCNFVEPCVSFMSDDFPAFYNAWENVFGPSKNRLLCAWHVDRAWTGHLQTITMVEKREKVHESLKIVLYEPSESCFQTMLEGLLKQLEEDPNTKSFHNYFSTYYKPREKQWAYCYRKNAKINTNNHVEAFHRVFKHIYLGGKNNARVDNCLVALGKYLKDKEFDVLIKYHKGKTTKKHTISAKRHSESLSIASHVQKVSETMWRVKSSNKNVLLYDVVKHHDCDDGCVVLCRKCYCCIKAYSCTCFDFCRHNNLCKHIHACVATQGTTISHVGSVVKKTSNCPITPKVNETEKGGPQKIRNSDIIECLNSLACTLSIKPDLDPLVAKNVISNLKKIEKQISIQMPDESVPQPKPNNNPCNKKMIPQRFKSVSRKGKASKKKAAKPAHMDDGIRSSLMGDLEIHSGNDHHYAGSSKTWGN